MPFDAHLMISEPGRYIEEYLDAGCDSITFHVEIEEPIAPTLGAIRGAGRAAGLAPSSRRRHRGPRAVPRAARHRPGDDRRAGLRRPAFMKDVLAAKAAGGARPPAAQALWRRGPRRWRDQPRDGGVRRSHGVDVFVVGLGAVRPGPRHGAARSGSSGRSPTRATSTASTTAAADPARPDGPLRVAAEASRAPLDGRDRGGRDPGDDARGDGQINPDGVRDYDLLVPASVEARRRAARRARERLLARGGRWRASSLRGPPGVRALLQRTTGAAVASTARSSARSVGLVVPARGRAGRRRGHGRRPGAAVASCGSSRRRRPDEQLAASTLAVRCWCRSSRSSPTRGAVAGPGSPARPARAGRAALRAGAAALRDLGLRRDRAVRGRDGGRARQRRPVHDLARHRRALDHDATAQGTGRQATRT